ncbi:uncharacterized protein LOC119672380 [Teleopsis dalmanni]|uniref:uncharacterized protein LOC119672380 n=1 Tax=Teleopsis dalmanni TaxID=139649 RepID=UPI0018CE3023|nr:uncharacterized protein LOC119672380 [Teleopsis dalmanni]
MNFPKDESSDCYIQCLLEIWNFYNPTHGLSVIEVTKQTSHLFPKVFNEIRKSLELCMKKFPEEGDKYRSCTWIGNVFKCFLKDYRKVFYLSFNIQELPCIQA